MKFVTWIPRIAAALISLIVTIAVISFVASNVKPVQVDLWPFELALEVPVFALLLGGLLVGFFCGAIVMWFSQGKNRRRGREAKREAAGLQRRVADLERQQVAGGETANPGQSRLPVSGDKS